MKFFIIGDPFTGLEKWLYEDEEPRGMPAVYNFYRYLGKSTKHSFNSIIVNKVQNKEIVFENGSKLVLKKLSIKNHHIFKIVALFYAFWLALTLCRKEKYDVIYGMAYYSMVSSFVGKILSITSVSRMFGSLIPKHLEEGNYKIIYTRYLLDLLSAKWAGDILISTNDGTKYNILANYVGRKKHFYHLYNGIDEQFEADLSHLKQVTQLNSSTQLNIAYIARLSWWKRQDLAVKVMELLVKKHHLNVKLHLIGNGPDKDQLIDLAKKLNIEQHLVFHGSLNRTELISTLNKMQICMFMYDHSNLGNALWESMFSGRLIVTRNSGDTGKVFQDDVNSILVPENDCVEEVANKIFTITNKDITKLTTNSRETVGKLIFNWDKRINNELEIIKVYMREQS